MNRSLDCLFKPRSIAVIGASRDRESIGGQIFQNLLKFEFTGAVYPVNPKSEVVQSVRAYRSVVEIPDEVDLAVIVVPASRVAAVVDECVEKGVKGLVILSAGFAEIGGAGRELQSAIMQKVRDHDMRMVGPNCLGLLNTDPEVKMDATFAPTWPPVGGVAFSSQSGALGLAILDYAKALGIGISQFISVGNKADVSGNDLLEYWEDDPATSVILLYLESFGNPRRFMDIAKRVSRKKPVAVVKSGRTAGGARAASSHTGALASRDVAVEALLSQTGVIRTDTIEELFDISMLLANQPIPKGARVGIITNAGGPGIMATDACESRGLQIQELGETTQQRLRAFLPPEAAVRNPVDMIASATPESFEKALPLVLADESIDAVMVLFVPPIATQATAVADAIRRGCSGSNKPVVTCFMGTHGIPPALSSLHQGRIPSYAFPEAAAIALSRAVRYGRWLDRPEGNIPELDRVDSVRGSAVLEKATSAGNEWLEPDSVSTLLESYGIRTLKSEFAADDLAAAAAAEQIGFPVALKLASENITHKSDVGGVVLGLENADDVRAAYAQIRQNLIDKGLYPKGMSGVIVQEMAGKGVETFIGVTREPVFGPLIAFGVGGTLVEVWRDIVFRVCPITDIDAREMLDAIRASKLLDGFRGAPAADRDAIVDALLRISQMVMDHPEIRELDINPLTALRPGTGAIAVDARVRVEVKA